MVAVGPHPSTPVTGTCRVYLGAQAIALKRFAAIVAGRPALSDLVSSNLFQAPQSFEGCRTFSIFVNLRQVFAKPSCLPISVARAVQCPLERLPGWYVSSLRFAKFCADPGLKQPCPTRKLPEPSQRILLPWSWIARGASRPPMHLWRTNRTSLSKTSVATPRRSFSPSIPSPRMWGVK